jgi:hypothetical protein
LSAHAGTVIAGARGAGCRGLVWRGRRVAAPAANAFQAGKLAASLPVIDTVEPASGVLFGTLLFGEQLAASPAGIAVQLAGAAAAIGGITLLGRYAGTPAIRDASGDAHPATGRRAHVSS